VHRTECLDRFQLDDDGVLDEQVQDVNPDRFLAVGEGNPMVPDVLDSPGVELQAQSRLGEAWRPLASWRSLVPSTISAG
jgi:hypothetical protein